MAIWEWFWGFVARLAFVVMWPGFMFYACLRWLIVGDDVIDTMDKFEDFFLG